MAGSRGIRNNNPLNIRISTNKWEGKITPNTDGSFEQFKTPEDGIRAGAKLLLVYNAHYKLSTVHGLINRFAPGNENDTRAYALEVAKDIGVTLNQTIDVDDYKTMSALIKAMIDYENDGDGCPYSDEIIRNALKRAGVHETPNTPLIREPAVQVAAVSGLGVAAQVVSTLTPLQTLLEGLLTTVPWAVGGIVLLVVAYIIYNHLSKRN